MIKNLSNGAYSAQVNMSLIVDGTIIEIYQMGPDFLFIGPADNHPPCEATIVFQVDQNERRWQVMLPDGISKASDRVALALTAAEAASL
jgi:hypothetical protein